SSIEGFDEDVSNELRDRGRQYLENRETELAAARVAAGVSDDVAQIEGLTSEMLVLLGEAAIKSLDDLGDLASDELIEIVGEKALSEAVASEIIMAARAHWFEDDEPVAVEGETPKENGALEAPVDAEPTQS
ncbi:MAG: transcription termination/antitermination protein NusA, partial [Rhodospirillales bacterium]|nr:transcription termination/antitermination protein NusA [Rhodospirillales bacterium]